MLRDEQSVRRMLAFWCVATQILVLTACAGTASTPSTSASGSAPSVQPAIPTDVQDFSRLDLKSELPSAAEVTQILGNDWTVAAPPVGGVFQGSPPTSNLKTVSPAPSGESECARLIREDPFDTGLLRTTGEVHARTPNGTPGGEGWASWNLFTYWGETRPLLQNYRNVSMACPQDPTSPIQQRSRRLYNSQLPGGLGLEEGDQGTCTEWAQGNLILEGCINPDPRLHQDAATLERQADHMVQTVLDHIAASLATS
jgi:hypothetical protein